MLTLLNLVNYVDKVKIGDSNLNILIVAGYDMDTKGK